MRRIFVVAVLLIVGTLSAVVAATQAPPAGPAGAGGRGQGGGGGGAPGLAIQKVKDNLFMVTGAGGNTAVFVMSGGVALVDTKNPNNGPGILEQVRSVTDKPVTLVINTHSHPDHTGSNEAFTGNVEFIAHENTAANMRRMTNPNFAGDKAAFVPYLTYQDRLEIGSGNDQIVLYYFGPAHTGGDSFVVFPALRTLHAGDAFASRGVPLIDTGNGGSAVGYATTLAAAVSTIKNVDTIINGHIGSPTAWADLVQYAEFNADFINWVRAQIKAGKTADQSAMEYTIPGKYQGYTRGGTLFGGLAGNIQTAYKELGAK